MDVLTLRVDLRRTEDRLARAREIGDRTAIILAEARLRRITQELTEAVGLRLSTTSATGTN